MACEPQPTAPSENPPKKSTLSVAYDPSLNVFLAQTLHVCHIYYAYIDPQNHPNVSIYMAYMECLGRAVWFNVMECLMCSFILSY